MDDGAAIAKAAIALLDRVTEKEKVRLAGIHVHNLDRVDPAQMGLFDTPARSRTNRLNRALDAVVSRFGEDAVTRGLVRAERAAPSRRIK